MKFKNKIKVLLLCLILAVCSLSLVACKNRNGGGGGGGNTPPQLPTFEDYVDDSRDGKYVTTDDVTIDGVLSNSEWGSQNFFVKTLEIGGVAHDIEFSSIFTSDGLVMGVSVLGTPAYYNAGRSLRNNSGIEFYLSPGDSTNINGTPTWEMQFSAAGISGSSKRNKAGKNGEWAYSSCNQYMVLESQIDGELNDPDNLGYVLEFMIPWSAIDLKAPPKNVCIDIAVIYCASQVGSREAWYSTAQNTRPDYAWVNPQGWHKLTADGYYDDTDYGLWRTSIFNPSIVFEENDESSFLYKHGFNAGARYLELNKTVTENNYQEVTIFNPAKFLPEVDLKMQGDSIESSLNGLLIKLQGGANSGVQWAAHFDSERTSGPLGIRLQEGNWNAIIFSETQLAKYNDPDRGLRIGMLNIGTNVYCYLENDDGVLELERQYNLTGRDKFTNDCERIIGLQLNTGGYFKDYRYYIGEDLNTIPYEINGGEALTGGSVKVEGNIVDGAAVEVIPDAGYDIKSFMVNGVSVDSNYYEVIANSTPKLNIEVEFELSSATKNTITLTVKGGLNYETPYTISDRVSFIGDKKAYGVIEDGQLTIDIADGDYNMIVEGYAPKAVTIADGQLVGGNEVLLSKNLFDITNTDWTVTETAGGGYTITSVKDDNGLNYDLDIVGLDNLDAFSFEFTYKATASSASLYYPAIIFYTESGTYRSFQFCQWQDDLTWKQGMPATERELLATIKNDINGSVTFDFKVVVSGTLVSLFVKNGDAYTPIHQFRDIHSKITGVSLNYIHDYDSSVTPEAWSFEGFKVTDLETSTVTVDDDIDNATVEVSNTTPVYGEVVKITVITDPVQGDDTYLVNKITVNGIECDFSIVNGNAVVEYVISSLNGTSYEVDALVLNAQYNDVTVSVKTGYPGVASTITFVEDGKGVIFTGLVNAMAIVTDGKISVNIPDGEYDVKIDGCYTVTVNVLNGQLPEIVFAKKLLDETDLTMPGAGDKAPFTTSDYSADKGYYVTSNVKNSIIAIKTEGIDLTRSFAVRLRISTTGITSSSKIFPAIWAGGQDDAGSSAYFNGQFCFWNGKLTWKNAGVNVQDTSITSSAVNVDEEVVIKFVKDGSSYWKIILVRENGSECGELTYANTTVGKNNIANITEAHYISSISQVSFYYTYDGSSPIGDWEFSNISIYNI